MHDTRQLVLQYRIEIVVLSFKPRNFEKLKIKWEKGKKEKYKESENTRKIKNGILQVSSCN